MTRDMRMITYKKVVYFPGPVRNLTIMPVMPVTCAVSICRGGLPGTAGTVSAVPLLGVVRRRRTSFLRCYFRKKHIITSINYLYKLNNLLVIILSTKHYKTLHLTIVYTVRV